MARLLPGLQAVPIPMGSETLFADLRVSSSHWLLSGTAPESGVQEVMRRVVRPGATVFDIGAHIGYHTVLLSQLVGPAGRVLAFEPNS